MFEVYYGGPRDPARETQLTAQVVALGGRFDYWEESGKSGVCLTYEFDNWPQAECAATILRKQKEHVEGPQEYGD